MKKYYNIAGLKFKASGSYIIAFQTLENAQLMSEIQMHNIYDMEDSVFIINKIQVRCVGCFAITENMRNVYLPGKSYREKVILDLKLSRKEMQEFIYLANKFYKKIMREYEKVKKL